MACGSSSVKTMKTTIAGIETFPVNYPTVGWFGSLNNSETRFTSRITFYVSRFPFLGKSGLQTIPDNFTGRPSRSERVAARPITTGCKPSTPVTGGV